MPHADGARAVYHLCLESAGHEGTLCSHLLSCQKVFEACAPLTFRVTYHTTGLCSCSDREDVEIDALAVRWWRKAFQPWSHDIGALWLVGVWALCLCVCCLSPYHWRCGTSPLGVSSAVDLGPHLSYEGKSGRKSDLYGGTIKLAASSKPGQDCIKTLASFHTWSEFSGATTYICKPELLSQVSLFSY